MTRPGCTERRGSPGMRDGCGPLFLPSCLPHSLLPSLLPLLIPIPIPAVPPPGRQVPLGRRRSLRDPGRLRQRGPAGEDAVPAAPACSLQPAGLVLPLQVVLPPLPAPQHRVELQAGHPDPRHPGHLPVCLHRLHRRPLAPESPRITQHNPPGARAVPQLGLLHLRPVLVRVLPDGGSPDAGPPPGEHRGHRRLLGPGRVCRRRQRRHLRQRDHQPSAAGPLVPQGAGPVPQLHGGPGGFPLRGALHRRAHRRGRLADVLRAGLAAPALVHQAGRGGHVPGVLGVHGQHLPLRQEEEHQEVPGVEEPPDGPESQRASQKPLKGC